MVTSSVRVPMGIDISLRASDTAISRRRTRSLMIHSRLVEFGRLPLGALVIAALLCGWSSTARGECGDHAVLARLGLVGNNVDVMALADFRSLPVSLPEAPLPCSGPYCSKSPAVPMPSAPGTTATGDRLQVWASLAVPAPCSPSSSFLPNESDAIRPHHEGCRIERPPRSL